VAVGLTGGALVDGGLSLRFLRGDLLSVGLAAAAGLALWGRWERVVARRYRRGGAGERRVGRRLEALARRGWLVVHDVPKPGGGNVDHLVAGPEAGLFTIETKLNRFGSGELAQARRHADWASRYFETSATAVLCVANGRGRPRRYAGVWCMGAGRLVSFLRRWEGEQVAVEQIAQRLP
jgi:hypothetical protein